MKAGMVRRQALLRRLFDSIKEPVDTRNSVSAYNHQVASFYIASHLELNQLYLLIKGETVEKVQKAALPTEEAFETLMKIIRDEARLMANTCKP